MPAAAAQPDAILPPEPVHSCPACSHWLPDGTLACPDCHTLAYGQYLSNIAHTAQAAEQQQQWPAALDQWRQALAWLPADTQQRNSVQQHIAQIEQRLAAEADRKSRWTKRLGPFAPIALFLLKIKSGLFLLFKLKFLLGIVGFFGLYWAIFGWRFAAGFTLALFLHEMGHYVAVRRRGLKADLPLFFPGLGAYVRWYGMGVSRQDLAAIALAGPLWGLGSALLCFGAFLATHSAIFLVLTYSIGWVNFLNLVPLLGLDGAQATYALSRMQRALIAATCLLFFGLTVPPNGDLTSNTVQWIFLIVGLAMTWKCFVQDTPETPHTRTFVSFQALVIALGLLIRISLTLGASRF